jgi:hypothetical protein
MKSIRFKGTLLGGHKDHAVEFPHNPEELWGIPARPLWPGRRGHHVRVKLNGATGDSCIVPRSKKYWLIVDEGLKKDAAVSEGDKVSVVVEPLASLDSAIQPFTSKVERAKTRK